MKRNFKYILLIMFMLFIGTPFLKAETLDCNYMFSPYGSLTDENNIKVNFRINDTSKGISINGINLTYIDGVSDSITISNKVKVGDYYFVIGKPINFLIKHSDNKCPTLKFKFDTTKSSSKIKYGNSKDGDKINLIKIYDSIGGITNGNDEELKLSSSLFDATLLNENMELNNCPKVDGTIGSTYYSIEQAASYLFNNDRYEKVFNVGICAYDNNVYYISVNGDNRVGAYVQLSSNDKGFLWESSMNLTGHNVHFGIRESEWAEINRAFPYEKGVSNSKNKKTLTFNKIKNPYFEPTTPMFIFSVKPVSDAISESTTGESDYNVNMDPLFNFNISQNISDRVGVCTDYLGSADEDGSVANLIDEIFDIAKIVSIILVIVLTMFEIVSAITKDKDELPNIIKKTVKRLIVLLIILLLPTFIDMIGNIIGIDDILCGIK